MTYTLAVLALYLFLPWLVVIAVHESLLKLIERCRR